MDLQQDISGGKSPRRQLQGPRPTPLKVRKDSHKIRKPPMAPPQQPPPRPPAIIYTVSPKIIHANPSEFMTLVQRLTGPDSTYPSSAAVPSSSSTAFHNNFNYGGTISPAARFASIEKIRTPQGKKPQVADIGGMVEGIDAEKPGFLPGILSPNPASLQPIPSNFFFPRFDQNPLGFLPDLSPVLHSNKNYLETGLMMPSPSNLFISPGIISPGTPSLDHFNTLFDLQHYS